MIKSALPFGLFLSLLTSTAALAQDASAPAVAEPDQNASASSQIPDTLMFSIDEYNDIQSRIAGSNETGAADRSAIEDASLYLSTILYFGPSDWTIWVNGVPITADQEFNSFQVTEIAPTHVQLLVPLSAQGMRPVRLEPNQTFITKSGIVVEGQVSGF